MFRGILLGTVAFGTVFLLERQLGTVFKDMRRYDKLRAMSGDSPLFVEGFKEVLGYVMRDQRGQGDRRKARAEIDKAAEQPARAAQSADGGSLFDTVRKDVTRYATMRAM